MTIAVVAGISLIDNLPPGVGLLFVLVLGISFQIDKQQRDIRKLAESTAFIALVLKEGVEEDE